MLSILNDIPSFALTSELDDFSIMADKTVNVTLSVMGSEIFSANYVPDSNREIHIRDLGSVIETYLTDNPLARFHYSVSAMSETMITKSFDVLLCRYKVADTGSAFVSSHFLTSLDGVKVIGSDSTEFLYATEASTTSALADHASAACVYVTTDNTVITENKTVAHTGVTGINKIDVSPAHFAVPGRELVRYTVTCGSRRMRYEIRGRSNSLAIRFENSFGCEETFTFGGEIEVNPQITRNAAHVNGRLINYAIKKDIHYKCYSPFIPAGMFSFADDIASSGDVSVVIGSNAIPATIVDSETIRDNSPSALHSFWIEFIASDLRGYRLPELTRIFDDSFDNSYN